MSTSNAAIARSSCIQARRVIILTTTYGLPPYRAILTLARGFADRNVATIRPRLVCVTQVWPKCLCQKKRTIILIGGTGTRKSHLCIAITANACALALAVRAAISASLMPPPQWKRGPFGTPIWTPIDTVIVQTRC